MTDQVLILQIYTTADLEHVETTIASVIRETKRWCKWVKEHRLQSFVIISDESPLGLINRMRDFYLGKPGIGGAYCFTAPDDLVGNYGNLEALRYHIDVARLQIRERQKSKDMRSTQRREFGVKRDMKHL